MDWLYLTFTNGYLVCDDGVLYTKRTFANEAEAEAWLEAEDLRATIR